MPRAAKKKNDIDPAGTYVCWQSGAALVDGEEYTFVAGERLRGDSPLVQATAQFWVIDGNEVPTHWDTVVERNEADRPPVADHDAVVVHQPVPLEREDVRALNRAITVLVGAGGTRSWSRMSAGPCSTPAPSCVRWCRMRSRRTTPIQFTRRGAK